MKKAIKNHHPRILSSIIFACLLPLVFLACEYGVTRLQPTSYWFEYYDFYPTQESYTSNEPITFISEADVHRPVKLEWTDVLRCDYGTGFQYTSVYESSYQYKEKRLFDKEDPQQWIWSGERPVVPTVCFADSTACAILPYGIKKCQQGVTEERFRLLP